MSFIYIQSEPRLWTVGHRAPGGQGPHRDWHPESDHHSDEQAAARCHYLNGGADPELLAALKALVNMQKGRENWPEVKAAEAAIAKAEGSAAPEDWQSVGVQMQAAFAKADARAEGRAP